MRLIRVLLYLCCATVSIQRTHAALSYVIDGDNSSIDFIVNFTKHLHNEQHFHSFICFSESLERNQPQNGMVRGLEQTLMEDFNVPIIVWGKQRTTKLRHHIGRNNLVFINIVSIDDAILNVVDYTLEGLHFVPMLFIYKSAGNITPSGAEIYEFFSWCWRKNIINVALIFQVLTSEWSEAAVRFRVHVHNQVYSYTPFPVLTVANLTKRSYTEQQGFIMGKIANTRGYQFNTPIALDPPTVLLTTRKRQEQVPTSYAITGTAGLLYQNFIKHLNGSIKIAPTQHNIPFHSAIFQKHYFSEVAEQRIDIGIHPYSELVPYANLTEGSYPIGQTNACIIVPILKEINNVNFFKRSTMKNNKLVLMGQLFAFFLLELFSKQPLYLGLKRIGRALWNAFGIMLLQPLSMTQLRYRRNLFSLVYPIVSLLNLILVSIFIGSMTAVFSKAVQQRQIVSVDDFLESNLKILLDEYEREAYFESSHLPAALISRLLVTDADNLTKHRDALNASYAYVVTTEMWTILNMQQQRLFSQTRFRIAGQELCTQEFFLKFPVQRNSPFIDSLAVFFLYTLESGLSLKWETLSMCQAISMKSVQMVNENLEYPVPLQFVHLRSAFKACVLMWMCSVLCFLGELMWHRWTTKRRGARSQTTTTAMTATPAVILPICAD